MRYLILLSALCVSFNVFAQSVDGKEVAAPVQQKKSLRHLVSNSEMMRSPVFTKRLYRQAKQVDQAVEKRQEEYLKEKKEKEKLTDAEVEAERKRIQKMRLIDYGMADVDLKSKSAEIEQDPVQAVYTLSENITYGGYGKTPEELAAEKAQREQLLEQERGLTETEYQAAKALEEPARALGRKSITINPDGFK